MNIGNIIHKKRKDLGLSSVEVAEKVGVSHATVLRWEQGYIKSIKADKLAVLANVLQLSPLELFEQPTEEEQAIIYKYRTLSPDDKRIVRTLIDACLVKV